MKDNMDTFSTELVIITLRDVAGLLEPSHPVSNLCLLIADKFADVDIGELRHTWSVILGGLSATALMLGLPYRVRHLLSALWSEDVMGIEYWGRSGCPRIAEYFVGEVVEAAGVKAGAGFKENAE